MNCTCITEMETKLSERVKNPDSKPWPDAQLESLSCAGVVLSFPECKTKLVIPFKTRWSRATKAGKRQTRLSEVNVEVSFCPFCGKSTATEGEVEA